MEPEPGGRKGGEERADRSVSRESHGDSLQGGLGIERVPPVGFLVDPSGYGVLSGGELLAGENQFSDHAGRDVGREGAVVAG